MIYKDVEWRYYRGALIPKPAPHVEMKLTPGEEKELLTRSKAYFLRYVTDWDSEDGEFWYVIKDTKESLENYKSKMKNQIRKGLKNCRVEKVDKSEIVQNGFAVYKTAFTGYQTDMTPMSQESFEKSILNADLNVTVDFWAVYNLKNILIAYSENIVDYDCVNYSSIKFHPDYMKDYPSYALFFKMNEYYLNEKKYQYVNDGARSISHITNIQDFLMNKFHFRKAYCRLHVVYRRDIGLIVWVLYPFRTLISKVHHKFFNKLSVLLKQEEIRRSFEK